MAGGVIMEKITAVNGQVIKWAREVCNMPVLFVSEKFKKDPDVIVAWEEGRDHPTYAQLEELGSLYKKPVAVFFFSNIPQVNPIKSSFRTLPEHDFETLSYKVIRKINDARTMQLNLYELHDGNNPATVLLTNVGFSMDIKQTAAKLRNVFGITLKEQKRSRRSDDALEIWRNCFLNYGVYVFKDAFEDDSISGFCLSDPNFPIIYINNSMSFTRQIFTLFHEFYHLISNTSGIDKIIDDYFDDLTSQQLYIETACNAFAGEFLVPDIDFLNEIKNEIIDELYVEKLAIRYNVSREVIMRKLLEHEMISSQQYEQKRDEYNVEALRARQQHKDESGGNYYNTKISYLGTGYLHQVYDKYTNNKISIFQLANYTRSKIEHLPKLEATWGWRVNS
jgi:Zn-dependent peptidase ImmA (M78 family)